MAGPPRLEPDIPLPPYGFVPGRSPHPRRDPAGHAFGRDEDGYGAPPTESDWITHRGYRHTLDLFNHGYYWEAHEGLEHWWKLLDEGDRRRALFQGLLHLAAAGVKARQGLGAGVHSHGTKAASRLREAARQLEPGSESGETTGPLLLGLRPAGLAEAAETIALKAYTFKAADPMPAVAAVLPVVLSLEP